MQEGENIKLIYLSDLFDKALVKAGLDDTTIQVIKQKVLESGSCQGVTEVPADIRRVFVVATDITGTEHVLMQAALQAFIDNSISKTINLPFEATVQDVEEVYKLAWEKGCKGITIYRQGSRNLEVLTVNSQVKSGLVEIIDQDHWPIIVPLEIPAEAETVGMPSRTYTVRTPFGKMRATITFKDDRPFDISLSIGRAGSDVNALTESLGRLISIALRSGVSSAVIADQLIGIGGSTQEQTLRPDKARSIPDAVGKLLLRCTQGTSDSDELEVDSGIQISGGNVAHASPNALCTACKQYTVVMVEGCSKCLPQLGGCGHSKC